MSLTTWKKKPEEKELLALVRKCGQGDQKALEKFFQIFSGDIYNFPIKIFHLDRDSASDFYLYAFERLRTGKRFRSFQGKSSFKTWFYSVLRNLVIDWMRTIKTVPTVSLNKVDSEGREYHTIEGEPDTSQEVTPFEEELLNQFQSSYQDLKIETRVIFKLAYIYFLNLTPEEIDFIAQKRGWTGDEVLQRVMEIRDQLSVRNESHMEAEDKITSLYQNILELKMKRRKLEKSLEEESEESLLARPDGYYTELEKIDQTLEKKYTQRDKLLARRERGNFLVRTPYKYISELLEIPEGSLSVQLMRTLEKMKNMMDQGLKNDKN